LTRFVTLLWHGEQAVGICLFTCPPLALKQRRRFFGMSGRWSRLCLQLLNRQLVNLSRVVLHPLYRGVGLASAFVRRSCELCPWPWIESLAQMGHVNPFFEKAGFVKVGRSKATTKSRTGHSALWGTQRGAGKRPKLVSAETFHKSRYAEPVYYVFDNRANAERDD